MPAARLLAEVGEDELHGLEGAVPVPERDVDAGVAEADDVGAAVPGQVGEEAWVLLDAPPTRRVPVLALLDVADATCAKEDGEVVGDRHAVDDRVPEEADEHVVPRLPVLVAGEVEDDRPEATQPEPTARIPEDAVGTKRRTRNHVTHAGAALDVRQLARVGLVEGNRVAEARRNAVAMLVPARREQKHRVRPQRVGERAVVVAAAVLL